MYRGVKTKISLARHRNFLRCPGSRRRAYASRAGILFFAGHNDSRVALEGLHYFGVVFPLKNGHLGLSYGLPANWRSVQNRAPGLRIAHRLPLMSRRIQVKMTAPTTAMRMLTINPCWPTPPKPN